MSWWTGGGFVAMAAAFALTGDLTGLEISADAQPVASRPVARQALPAPAGCPIPPRFRRDFAHAARRTKVPLPLLVAMAHEESRMDPSARSGAGARGLFQLMPATARELGLDPDIPRSNVLAGARYIDHMLERFGGLDLALSAYNAGPTAVARSGGAQHMETLSYVENVKLRAASLKSCS